MAFEPTPLKIPTTIDCANCGAKIYPEERHDCQAYFRGGFKPALEDPGNVPDPDPEEELISKPLKKIDQ